MQNIPITNLYYLLCYSWSRLDEGDLIDIDLERHDRLINLLAHVLHKGVSRLFRRGMDQVYEENGEETSRPRGRFDFSESLKAPLLAKNRLFCWYEELTKNALHNQIILTTIHSLCRCPELDGRLRHQLSVTAKHFSGISTISLRAEHFRRVQLHRNNGSYRFLLNVCELFFSSLIPDGSTGTYRFQDFTRDEVKMRRVFQEFVFNFYKMEQRDFRVSSEMLKWDVSSLSEGTSAFLPDMRTDVCLDSPTRKIVIECKYTPTLLQSYWGSSTFRSEHLYQLFSYLKHFEKLGGRHLACEGLLLYPSASKSLDSVFVTQGHPVRVATLDLTESWTSIRTRLFSFLNDWSTSTLLPVV